MSWVAVLMGSESDWPVMQSTTSMLKTLGVQYEVKVTSAHRTPAGTQAYVTDAEERGLPGASDEEILAAMASDPILIERPLVETEKGARLCRPQDLVLEIL